MAERSTRSLTIYRTMGKIGAFALFFGCFCPILAGQRLSTADLFFGALGHLTRGEMGAVGIDGVLAFVLLLVSSHCLMTVVVGQVEQLRGPAVQAWVVLLISYSYHFGIVIPIHYGADWGWSILFLGATLVAFGSFRAHSELEDEPDQQPPGTHTARPSGKDTRKK